MPEFLLEVGCEEIPAGWLPRLTQELRFQFQAKALEARLSHASPVRVDRIVGQGLPETAAPPTETLSTPRRLVLRADLPSKQYADKREFWGPALGAAKDANGAWTKAAIGFATKVGVSPDRLQLRVKAGTEQRLFFTKDLPTDATLAVLPGVIASTLRSLSFPKQMNWDAWLADGKGAFPFGRPIRWVVAIFGGKVVPFRIHALVDGAEQGPVIVKSGRTTFGHRFLPPRKAGRPIAVSDYRNYRRTLRDHFVLLEPETRRKRIERAIARLPLASGPGAVADLTQAWTNLAEHPTVVVGKLSRDVQHLPLDVTATVLRLHQKYLSLHQRHPDPRSTSRVTGFAALIDNNGKRRKTIIRGMERVVVARLRDAAFFLKEDRSRRLAERVDDLEGVTFHKQLGTYKDKALRLVRLVDVMANEMGLLHEDARDAARQAALLCKADLTTLMVREFTELQGTMGGEYLEREGASPVVAAAVRWHYFPVSLDRRKDPSGLPKGLGALALWAVSLADRLDTLAAYFGIGLAPSGSSDPLGLRRAAQGVVRILLEFWHVDAANRRPNLRHLVAAAVAGMKGRLETSAADVQRDLEEFLLNRLGYVIEANALGADESQQDSVRKYLGTEHPVGQVVAAALGAQEPDALDDPLEAFSRFKALSTVRDEAHGALKHLGALFKRINNILADQTPASPISTDLFDPNRQVEGDLYRAVRDPANTLGSYEERLRALLKLSDPIDRFFDPNVGVFVMDENLAVRANRLALLAEARQLFYRIADISKLGG